MPSTMRAATRGATAQHHCMRTRRTAIAIDRGQPARAICQQSLAAPHARR
jgi:hypothetical protein